MSCQILDIGRVAAHDVRPQPHRGAVHASAGCPKHHKSAMDRWAPSLCRAHSAGDEVLEVTGDAPLSGIASITVAMHLAARFFAFVARRYFRWPGVGGVVAHVCAFRIPETG